KPKGVLVSNRGFEKHCQACIKTYGLTSEDRVLQFAPIFFDAGLEQIFPALITGATLVMRGETPWAATTFHQKVNEYELTILDLPPLYIKELLNYWDRHPEFAPRGLKHVLTGGEALPVEVAKQWLASPVGDVPLLNVYGPTEAIVTATMFRVHSSNVNACATASVPIGRPLPGRILRILDENGKAVPPGVPGELCIGGECLAEGYYGEPELTAQAFTFWDAENEAGGWLKKDGRDSCKALRLYRSGDRVRLTDYGVIEFLGRLDRQIKLRGFRIDLGEIEAGLCEQSQVLEACVVLQKDQTSGEAFLVAYIVAQTAKNELGENALDEIRIRLKERLPGYMVPQRLVLIPKIPVTAAGKVDEKNLPKVSPTTAKVLSGQKEPLSEIEKVVATIWKDLLKCDHVGRHDNFFDLGGHSLLILRLHARLADELGSQLEVVDLFRYPTVATQARAISDISGGSTIPEKTSPAVVKSEINDIKNNDIAVIGMAGRFPGADNLDLFWKNLETETESITFFSREELLAAGFPADQIEHPDFIAALGNLPDIEMFDAKLFGFSPREASEMDPQHRIFLETAWHTLENGGYDPFRYPGKIGVFAGCSMNTYLLNNLVANKMFNNTMAGFQLSMGNDKDFLPTKTSYKLNLRGPSVNVNTACSTSLTAIHMACQALLAGECEMALAGGVSIHTPQISGHLHQQNGIASADGHCRAFSEDAAGTVAGNGVGIILLKRLADAVRDRDTIDAVIKGSALNNDGADKVGFTAPGVTGQREVILDALAAAGVTAESISYVEAHG
ncbi:AMP-binding protein, partial [bacterium]|nr:AMP-binding protein [bacterium]